MHHKLLLVFRDRLFEFWELYAYALCDI